MKTAKCITTNELGGDGLSQKELRAAWEQDMRTQEVIKYLVKKDCEICGHPTKYHYETNEFQRRCISDCYCTAPIKRIKQFAVDRTLEYIFDSKNS